MTSEKAAVLSWLYRNEFPPGILDFEEILTSATRNALGKSSLDAPGYVQSNRNRYWNLILQRQDLDERSGRTPIFSIVDKIGRRIEWPAATRTSSPKSTGRAQARLRARPAILRTIDNLSDRQFEALGCVASEFAGGTRFSLTPPGNEGGIDFFSLIQIHSGCHLFSSDCHPLRIVGQAKKHSRPASVDMIKEFITTLSEVKNLSPSIEHLIPPWFRSASGPIVGWFISHSGAQSGAVAKAHNHGILLADSIDLAEIAARSRYIPEHLNPQERSAQLLDRIQSNLK